MFTPDVRISAIASFVPRCGVLADVGSDHAYLPVRLLADGVIQKAVVTDINEGPLLNSKKTAEKYGFTDRCEFLRGDGFAPLKNMDIDVITVSGMGGELISRMLEEHTEIARAASRLVLQPMTEIPAVMRTLVENGFSIIDEAVVRDRHLYYHIIAVCADKTKKAFNYGVCDDFEFSRMLIERKDETYREYLTFKRDLTKKFMSGKGISEEALKGLNAKYIKITECLKNYER